MTNARKQLGQQGEQLAARFLFAKGYAIVAQNFQTRRAEIDIIAWHEKPHHGQTLCFIEVKTRQKNDGSAERAHDGNKRQHIMSAARAFCRKYRINTEHTPIQFEQVSVYVQEQRLQHFILPVD